MKMGTTRSPSHYDPAADQAIQPDDLRRTAILRYALWAAVLPISRLVRLLFDSGPFNSGNGVMGQMSPKAFDLWQRTLAEGLMRCGIASESAGLLASTVPAAFEGGLVQARVARSKELL
ncbi:hypothetical protein [Bradyrhizobium sp. CCGUVB23]|uniref:LmrA/YxaF family transcription factor n=1 Tax=Bradyrhizobium sp. CCGUVB23 TaxID=2949630 RepID=UPI003531D527